MKIWSLRVSDQAMQLTFKNDEDLHIYDNFIGESMLSWWRPIDLVAYKKGRHRDIAYFGTAVYAISLNVGSKLKDFLEGSTELLEVNVVNYDSDFRFLNVINVMDVLDHDRSVFVKDRWDRIVDYDALYFKECEIKNVDIFKIPEFVKHTIFVSDRFRDFVINSKIKGFEFEEVWDSEFTVEMEQQLHQQYVDALARVESYSGPTVDWSDAFRLVEAGKAMASGKWKLQMDPQGYLLIGNLIDGGQYSWIIPKYIAPILLDLQWHEVEKSEL